MTRHEEAETVIRLISGKTIARTHPVYIKCLEWLGYWPEEIPREVKTKLFAEVCKSFGVDEGGLLLDISRGTHNGKKPKPIEDAFIGEDELRAILPKGGWFEWYDQFTIQTEAPLSFHIASSLSALGSAIGRKAFVSMGGHWQIYPNYCTILIGPTGRVKKTTAINIAKKLVMQATCCPIMADQMTPEAFQNELIENGGHQFVCAPEFTVLFNKQRYNEGFVTKIIRMLDCPDTFEVVTMARGKQEVTSLCLSIIGGSTLSLLATAAPSDVLSSGFLNRFQLVVENSTNRIFPIPGQFNPVIAEKLVESLKRLKSFIGAFTLNPAAFAFYENWYRARAKFLRNVQDEMTAEVLERSADHFLRMSMLIHAVQCDSQYICEECIKAAAELLKYNEQRIPQLVNNISQTVSSQDTEYVFTIIQRAGGIGHSDLLHKVSHRMNAGLFKTHLGTLIESGRIKEEKRGAMKFYVLEA